MDSRHCGTTHASNYGDVTSLILVLYLKVHLRQLWLVQYKQEKLM